MASAGAAALAIVGLCVSESAQTGAVGNEPRNFQAIARLRDGFGVLDLLGHACVDLLLSCDLPWPLESCSFLS